MLATERRWRRQLLRDPSVVLYLPLYELDGGAFKSADNYGHLCTVTGATWGIQGRDFVGTGYISLGNNAAFTPNSITIGFWCYARPTAGYPEIVSCSNDTDGAYKIYRTPTGTFACCLATDDNAWNCAAVYTAATTDNSWQLVWMTYDKDGGANNLKLALNDSAAVNIATKTGNLKATGDNLTIGARDSTPDAPFDGIVEEVIIYNRALNPMERQHNYLATKWRYRG